MYLGVYEKPSGRIIKESEFGMRNNFRMKITEHQKA